MAHQKTIPYNEILALVKRGYTIGEACIKAGLPDTTRFYKYAPGIVKAEILGFKTTNAKTISVKASDIKGGQFLTQVFRPSEIDDSDEY